MRTKFHLANLLFHNSNLWHTRKTISNFSSNILRLRQNGCHFRDDNFKSIFLNENLCIFIQISLKYVPKGAIDKHSIGSHNGLAPSHYMYQWRSSLLMRLIHICATPSQRVNPLWPSEAIRRQGTESTLAQVMACCLMAPSHYLNQCWLIINKVLWHSSEGIIMRRSEDTNQ